MDSTPPNNVDNANTIQSGMLGSPIFSHIICRGAANSTSPLPAPISQLCSQNSFSSAHRGEVGCFRKLEPHMQLTQHQCMQYFTAPLSEADPAAAGAAALASAGAAAGVAAPKLKAPAAAGAAALESAGAEAPKLNPPAAGAGAAGVFVSAEAEEFLESVVVLVAAPKPKPPPVAVAGAGATAPKPNPDDAAAGAGVVLGGAEAFVAPPKLKPVEGAAAAAAGAPNFGAASGLAEEAAPKLSPAEPKPDPGAAAAAAGAGAAPPKLKEGVDAAPPVLAPADGAALPKENEDVAGAAVLAVVAGAAAPKLNDEAAGAEGAPPKDKPLAGVVAGAGAEAPNENPADDAGFAAAGVAAAVPEAPNVIPPPNAPNKVLKNY